MKKNLTLFVVSLFLFNANAVPLSGTYCIGPSSFYTPPGGGSYVNGLFPFSTLSAAIASLNANGASGHVIFELQNNYTSSSEVVPIDILYQGTPAATVTIRPRIDLAGQLVFSRSVSALGVPGGMINFKGADYVKIDGSPGGTNGTTIGLIIRNTSGSASVLPPVNFMNEATHNTLNAVQVEGRFICVRIDSTGINGNDFLTFSNCTFRERTDVVSTAVSNLVVSTGAFPAVNNDIIFHNNNFCNWGVLSVSVANNATGNWTFTNNHFFLTGSFSAGGSRMFGFSSPSSAVNLLFTNNNIGGSAPGTTGAKMNSVSACVDVSIPDNAYCSFVNNRFANMRVSGPVSSFYAIRTGGLATIKNNIIGDPLVADDIVLDSTANAIINIIDYAASATDDSVEISGNTISNLTFKSPSSFGTVKMLNFANDDLIIHPALITNNVIRNIYNAGKGFMSVIDVFAPQIFVSKVNIMNNSMENIVMMHDSSQAFTGINVFQSAYLKGNRIGSLSAPNSILLKGFAHHKGINTSGNNNRVIIELDTIANISAANNFNTATQLTGISVSNTNGVIISITDNLVNKLSTASIRSANLNAVSSGYTVAGIQFSASGSMLIEDNVVTEIHATTPAPVSSIVAGIVNTSSNPSIASNTINSLNASSAGLPAVIGLYNLKSLIGICHIYNNMISLNNGNMMNAADVYGIIEDGGITTTMTAFHYNTVSITGNATGASTSACFLFNRITPGTWLLNNLFNNTRIGGLKNYAVCNKVGNASHWLSTTSDYNNIYASDPLTVARWAGSDQTLSQWKASTGGDTHSISSPAVFVSDIDLHLIPSDPANCYFNGAAYDTSFTTSDFDHTGRSTTAADIGADEFAGLQAGMALSLMLEGLYAGGSLTPVLFNTGLSTDPSHCDSVTVELHEDMAPFNTAYSGKWLLKTDGTIQCNLPCSFLTGDYYIVVKGRNVIETWSKFPVAFTGNTIYTFKD